MTWLIAYTNDHFSFSGSTNILCSWSFGFEFKAQLTVGRGQVCSSYTSPMSDWLGNGHAAVFWPMKHKGAFSGAQGRFSTLIKWGRHMRRLPFMYSAFHLASDNMIWEKDIWAKEENHFSTRWKKLNPLMTVSSQPRCHLPPDLLLSEKLKFCLPKYFISVV